jgi:hypothetical protein
LTTPADSVALDDYRWLVGPQAATALADAAGRRDWLAIAKKLRKTLGPTRARLVLEQTELRQRAAEKFRDCQRMFFERTALAQATDQWVACYKASRFPQNAPVADLCSGLGGDLLGLAARGPAVAVERDPVKALLADANQRRVAPAAGAEVRLADATRINVDQFAAWHIDPDRRPHGRRTTRLELHEPNLRAIDGLLARNPNAAIKLAPASVAPDRWAQMAELEWISRAGQCRQLVAWFGMLSRAPGQRAATIVAPDGRWSRRITGRPGVEAPLSSVGAWIFEPDPAVIAADLVGHVAQELCLGRVAEQVAYLTGDRLIEDRALRAYQVLEVLPFDLRRLKALLRRRSIGRLVVKKRGIADDPEKLRRQLRSRGDNEATLIVTRRGQQAVAILAQPAPLCGAKALC